MSDIIYRHSSGQFLGQMITSWVVVFQCISFIFVLNFIIYFLLLQWVWFIIVCLISWGTMISCLRCFCFFHSDIVTINFPFISIFARFPKFWNAAYSFLIISRKIFSSVPNIFVGLLFYWEKVASFLCTYVISKVFLLFTSSFQKGYLTWIYIFLLCSDLFLWSTLWSLLKKISCAVECIL